VFFSIYNGFLVIIIILTLVVNFVEDIIVVY